MDKFLGPMRTCAKHAAPLLALAALLQLPPLLTPLQSEDAPKRPRITGIDHVRLYVSDEDASRQFYMKYFGLPAQPGFGCKYSPRTCFPLNLWQRIELERAPSPAPQKWLAEVGYATDDVSQMRRYLVKHNVKCSRITEDGSGYRHFELVDPEGNSLAFVQGPSVGGDWPVFPQVSTHLIHAGFVVKDVAAENKFYIDVLGFRLYWQGGFKDDGLDWYEIQVPDGPDWIEYMLNIPANADHKELGVQNHFSLGVRDIHAAADQLHENGIAKFDGPEIGRDGKWGLDAYDPDGTRVEVMEFTPAREPCCHPYTAPHPQR